VPQVGIIHRRTQLPRLGTTPKEAMKGCKYCGNCNTLRIGYLLFSSCLQSTASGVRNGNLQGRSISRLRENIKAKAGRSKQMWLQLQLFCVQLSAKPTSHDMGFPGSQKPVVPSWGAVENIALAIPRGSDGKTRLTGDDHAPGSRVSPPSPVALARSAVSGPEQSR
jgi:hypothetical protein